MSKKAIICGVGPGNGMAIARAFAKGGYDLALLARNKQKLEGYAEDDGLKGVTVKTVAADFSDMASTDKGVRQAIAELGGVDVLLYNASLYVAKSWRELTGPDLMNEVTVGAGSAVAAMRAAGETMAENDGGTIIATGGGSALDPTVVIEAPGLAVTKGAMRNAVLALAPQYAQDNIYLATLTIMGTVQPGTFYDPANIAEAIYEVAHVPENERVSEVLFASREDREAFLNRYA
ncbi:MAG: SDR family NAD(P)-dependent oxidoreductase [Aquisalinus sp.]|nr:SDR family NAD(P)-dependent oxidoreductase [Aquisalinus sp.]